VRPSTLPIATTPLPAKRGFKLVARSQWPSKAYTTVKRAKSLFETACGSYRENVNASPDRSQRQNDPSP
jgi:hypothetical protein